jgi:hypothetical protein
LAVCRAKSSDRVLELLFRGGAQAAWRAAWDPAGGEDATDGAGTDLVAELDQFAVDAPVAPSWIIPEPGGARDHIDRR